MLAAHEQQLAEHGGPVGVRDMSLLQSALARPQNKAAYGTPGVADMAAAYDCAVARTLPFVDGNKRIALLATETFLIDNGYDLAADEAALYDAVMKLAAGDITEDGFAAWLRDNIVATGLGPVKHVASEPAHGLFRPRHAMPKPGRFMYSSPRRNRRCSSIA